MAWGACLAEIRKAAGIKNLSDDELAGFMDDILKRRAQIRAARRGEDSFPAAAAELSAEARMEAAILKRNQLMNLTKRIARREFYASAPSVGATPGVVMGLQAKLAGVNTPFAGSRLSVEAAGRVLWRDYLVGLSTELEQAGLFKAVRRGALDRQWARELFELSLGESGNPGATGSAEALTIARIVERYQRAARLGVNRAGGWVGAYQGYITRTSHDPERLLQAGFEPWRNRIVALLDQDKTFGHLDSPADVQAFLKNAYDGLASGVHLTAEGAVGFKDPAFTGPANLAKRMSQARALHFRDADAWLDYHAEFGRGTLIESVLHSLEIAARNTALMREFGTNPRAEFEADLKFLGESNRASAATTGALRNTRTRFEQQFAVLDGTAFMPVNRMAARIFAGWRVAQSLAKLGGVLLTSLTDIPFKARELRYQGVNLLEAYGDGVAALVRGRGKGEVRQVMDLLRAGADGMVGDVASRFDGIDTPAGTMSKLADHFFRWTGVTYWTDAQRGGAELILARHLALHADRAWPALPPAIRRGLAPYGIDAEKWELIRSADLAQANGRRYVTPDLATRLSDASVERALDPDIQKIAADIAGAQARLAAADTREAAWVAARKAKFDAKMARAQIRLAEFRSRTKGRADASAQGLALRMELLEAQRARFEVETDIAGALAGLKDQQAIRRFLDAVEEGKTARRVAGASDAAVERSAARNLALGERLGDRRRASQEQVARLGERIEELRTGERQDVEAQALILRGEFNARAEEFAAFADRVQTRSAARAERFQALLASLPARVARLKDDYRRDLAHALHAYFADRANAAVIRPGVREQALLTMGERPGTALGEALRLATQFKAFPAAVITRAWGREIYGGQSGMERVGGLTHMLVGTWLFGYLAMSAKDLVKGRSLRDPTDPRTWAAALLQGGGLGIYGDFLFGEYNRFGQGFWASALGPTAGVVEDLAKLWTDARQGDTKAADALRIAINNTPFVNLFYTRMALDYLVLYQVQEALNPGFLERFERRVEENNAQSFWLHPSQAIPYGGGDRLFEGVRP